ncbi:hypothetical protein CERSUDRAFT_163644 [Gelatoporia subvermispora B]|uniref:Fe2OG dioxygenase domain-containing protein n=1 Tax=Ceriporiopsis subvermispora (strain B) TaxID=914234 RepID=M2P6K3_CERS8|nr:hypothetical protein CERSUDRAFT_163644 [Gelatoporia subvermispora B]
MIAGDLKSFQVTDADEVFYLPDFVTKEEEEILLRKITESPLPKWKQLSKRRLQIWGGDMTTKRLLIPQPMPDFIGKYPNLIARIRETGAFSASPHSGPNHVILNEYLPGQGIMPHEDGPAYYPTVATLSLGSHALFHYYQYQLSADTENTDDAESGRTIDPQPVLTVLLEPRSLIITRSSLYEAHLHGIDGVTEDTFFAPISSQHGTTPPIANAHMLTGAAERDAVTRGGTLSRGTRYSLTFRDVARVANGARLLQS